MKKTILLCTLILLYNIKTRGQVQGNSRYNDIQSNFRFFNSQNSTAHNSATHVNTIENDAVTLSVNGLMNVVANQYVAVFNMIQVGETAATTDELMNNRINQLTEQMKKTGIEPAAITVDLVSFVPKYEYKEEDRFFSKTYNEVPAGFELQKNIRISYDKSAKLDQIVSAAAAVEIFDLVKVDYVVNDMQKVYAELRDKCVQAIKAKVKSYESLGFKLDTCSKTLGEDYRSVYPPERYFNYQGFSKPSMDAVKKKSFTGASSIIKNIQPPNSKYYDQVNYNDYDVVLNPALPEPAVQFSYSITVKYFLKKDAPLKNQYYIITPQGEAKPVFAK